LPTTAVLSLTVDCAAVSSFDHCCQLSAAVAVEAVSPMTATVISVLALSALPLSSST